MSNKFVRFSKALGNESVKRLPYIFFIFICLVAYQGWRNNQISKSNSADSKLLLMKVASLSEDNKRLNEQNKSLAKQGVILANQAVELNKCIGYTFATYTQTLRPVYFDNIDKCIIESPNIPPTQRPSATTSPQPSSSNRSRGSAPSSLPKSEPKRDEGLIPDSIPLIGPLI